MDKELLADFDQFFEMYKTNWRNGSLEAMKSAMSSTYAAREVRVSNIQDDIEDFGFKDAKQGWKQAFDYFSDKTVDWTFIEVNKVPLRINEVLVMFWVWPTVNGEESKTAHLYVDTFRKGKDWKLLRSYIEASVPLTNLQNNG
ncbi:hypothetical protein [Pseudalkalibacillus decolorationis]|uniref:hypothetical protein n=1 Tax=Pseudalkalibacillus decolorationis TaxID=163879 RepID=UPI002147C656|nr:hypothetical protein [Pseudalkalibacillus decolorationis]